MAVLNRVGDRDMAAVWVVAVGGSYVTVSYRVKKFKFCPCLLSPTDGHCLPLSGVQGIKPGEFQSPPGVRIWGKQEEFD